MTDKPVVWIATPLRHFEHDGEMTSGVFDKLADHYKKPIRELGLWPECPWDLQLQIVGGGGVARARNRFCSDFMAKPGRADDCIFFVDYDLMPTAQDNIQILSHDIGIIGGLYTTRAEQGHWVLNKLSGARPSDSGILPVMELGTGFLKIRRDTFEKVLNDNPWLDCESDFDHRKRELGFFSMGPVWDRKLWPGRGRWLTEDYWFEWLARESGIPTVVDTKVKLRHKDDFTGKIFPAVFPADPGKLPDEEREL